MPRYPEGQDFIIKRPFRLRSHFRVCRWQALRCVHVPIDHEYFQTNFTFKEVILVSLYIKAIEFETIPDT